MEILHWTPRLNEETATWGNRCENSVEGFNQQNLKSAGDVAPLPVYVENLKCLDLSGDARISKDHPTSSSKT